MTSNHNQAHISHLRTWPFLSATLITDTTKSVHTKSLSCCFVIYTSQKAKYIWYFPPGLVNYPRVHNLTSVSCPFWKTLSDDMEQRLKWCICKVVIPLLKKMWILCHIASDVKLHFSKNVKTKELNNFTLHALPSLLIDIQACEMDTQLYCNIFLLSYSEHTFIWEPSEAEWQHIFLWLWASEAPVSFMCLL